MYDVLVSVPARANAIFLIDFDNHFFTILSILMRNFSSKSSVSLINSEILWIYD